MTALQVGSLHPLEPAAPFARTRAQVTAMVGRSTSVSFDLLVTPASVHGPEGEGAVWIEQLCVFQAAHPNVPEFLRTADSFSSLFCKIHELSPISLRSLLSCRRPLTHRSKVTTLRHDGSRAEPPEAGEL